MALGVLLVVWDVEELVSPEEVVVDEVLLLVDAVVVVVVVGGGDVVGITVDPWEGDEEEGEYLVSIGVSFSSSLIGDPAEVLAVLGSQIGWKVTDDSWLALSELLLLFRFASFGSLVVLSLLLLSLVVGPLLGAFLDDGLGGTLEVSVVASSLSEGNTESLTDSGSVESVSVLFVDSLKPLWARVWWYFNPLICLYFLLQFGSGHSIKARGGACKVGVVGSLENTLGVGVFRDWERLRLLPFLADSGTGLNSRSGRDLRLPFTLVGASHFTGLAGTVKFEFAVLRPFPLRNLLWTLRKSTEVLPRFALLFLLALASISLVGDSQKRGGAQSCLVQSNKVPT